jgi:hypothetical protein
LQHRIRLQGFKASRLQGFKASRLQGFKASRLQGFKASPRKIVESFRKFVHNLP